MFNHRLPVFITDTHPCSYLEDKEARTAFLDPGIPVDKRLASTLNLRGFRRSGRYLYKTSCPSCNECKPLRILVSEFQANKSQKRTKKNNQALQTRVLTLDEISTELKDQYYEMYENYICARHQEGDMYPPSREQFDSFVGETFDFSRFIEFRDESDLVMVALCDLLDDGLSAIYTFFDPTKSKLGLGVYSVLWQIDYCLENSLPYLYMGFWVRDCDKMNYKSGYKPHHIFHNDRWQADDHS